MSRTARLAREYTELTDEQCEAARESSRQLAPVMNSDIRVHIAETDEDVMLPAPAVRVLVEALVELAKGGAVSVAAVPAELTTQQAADILNVSRPYLVKMLEEKRLPHHRIGTHRRLLLKDVVAYKRERYEKRMKVLDELTAQAQELNMGY